MRERINNQIRASEVRVISDKGENLGVLSLRKALDKAREAGLDLVLISPKARPQIAKITNYGKYKYDKNKKAKEAKTTAKKATETKAIQIKIGTGDNDLALKARKASKWLEEGHRIKVELFLRGRSKYMPEQFLRERLDRVLHLISLDYKISENYRRGPKGPIITIEKAK